MSSAARYHISARPIGFTNKSDAGQKIVQSGKITSASPSTPSTIVTVSAGPKDCDLYLMIEGCFIDAVAKTGHGFSWFQLSEPGVDPVMVQTEKAVEDSPRVLLEPTAAYTGPGAPGWQMFVRAGQRFAIIDAGFAS